MKEKVKLEKTGVRPTDDWINSPERKEAWVAFTSYPNINTNCLSFEHSQEFANARQAYRKRMNG